MKTPATRLFILALACALVLSRVHATNTELDGNLTINPLAEPVRLELTGPLASGLSGDHGVWLDYQDAATGIATFGLYRSLGEWRWQIATGQVVNGTPIDRLQMTLETTNKLTLFHQSDSTKSIVIDPKESQITINGQQVITSADLIAGISQVRADGLLSIAPPAGSGFAGARLTMGNADWGLSTVEGDGLIGDGMRLNYYGAGNRGTGFYDTASNQYRLVLKGGNVGVGSVNPVADGGTVLEVANHDANRATLKLSSGGGGEGYSFITLCDNGTRTWDLGKNTAQDFYLYNQASWNTAMVILRSNSNVGIGTTWPEEKLHVGGNIRTDGAVQLTQGGFISANTWG